MLATTFSGGVHPAGYKHLAKDKKIRPARPVSQLFLALSQHTGKPSLPLVKPGDKVTAGAKVGQAAGFISSCLHSPVSGTVRAIQDAPHPVIGRSLAIIIDVDAGTNVGAGPCACPSTGRAPTFDLNGIAPQDIIQKIADAGVVGLGGAAFPTHVKLSPPKDKKIDTLIINGAECEPYLACDHRLMLERPADIMSGAGIICRALGVNNCVIGIEDNKPDAVCAMKKQLAISHSLLANSQQPIANNMKIVSLAAKYPQGAEKQLIRALTGREAPSGGLPFDVGVVVQNVATALAVYEAVMLNKPLYERVVTVSGDCIKEPSNLLAAIGTPVSHLIEECGGFSEEPAKLIFGGPMMGITQASLDTPVIKGTSGILFLSKRAVGATQRVAPTYCIRCGGCVRVCPAGLEPTNIYYAAENADYGLAKEYGAQDCIECGACSFECPAKLELAGMIKYAKKMI